MPLGIGQEVLSIKGRRAIVGYNPSLHVVQIGQEYTTQRTPGATVQVVEIGERFLLTTLVEGRLREDDLFDFSVAVKLKDEDRPPFRPHHLSVSLGVVNHGSIVISGENLFESAGQSGLVFHYRYERDQKWDFGFQLMRLSGTTLIGEDLFFYYQQDALTRGLSQEYESKLQRTALMARRKLWTSFFLDFSLAVTTYTLEGDLESTFRGVDLGAMFGYHLKFQHRYFIEAGVGAGLSLLGSSNIANPANLPTLDIEGSARAFNTQYSLSAGFCF